MSDETRVPSIVHHGDGLDALAGLEPASVRLIVTSPPYRADKEYESWESLDEYRVFAKQWTALASRALTDDGSLWINLGYTKLDRNETLPLTYLYYDVVELPLVQEIVWHYEGGMPYKLRFTHRTERWQWYAKDPNKAIFNLDAVRDPTLNRTNDKRNNPLGKNPTDYWYFDRVTNNGQNKTVHPCQFPEPMIERIIRACSHPGDFVVDPFAGSGTTGVVARREGRWSLLVEKERAYVEAAKERLEVIPVSRQDES